METIVAAADFQRQREDILELLPVSTVETFRKNQVIYAPDQPSTGISLVVAGTVRLSQIADDGYELLLEIVGVDEVFGESAFLNTAQISETATAHENATLMVWPVPVIEDLMMKTPRLAASLLQVSAQRGADFAHRIESLAFDKIDRRLARALIRFSERLGAPTADGSIRILPISQELLGRHIGTSREVVSAHMNRFRRRGYLDYSRAGIVLHGKTLAAWIANKSPISESSCLDRTSARAATTAL